MMKPIAALSDSGSGQFPALFRAVRSGLVCAALTLAAVFPVAEIARADEGGVSFWVPGLFGSLAAVPQQAGWSATLIYYHTSLSAGGDVSLAREFQIGSIPASVSAHASANLNGTGDLGIFAPSYVFATPIFGGQAAATLMAIYGNTSASLNGTVSGTLGGMPFGPLSANIGNSATGFGDLYPQFALRWNSGVNNYMTYVAGDVPVGDYSSSSLSNVGIGHGAIDGGGGYTYFNPQTGHELSGVLGLTYNLLNPSTQYQNGVDLHFDWGASQFLTKQIQVGLVGYAYKDIGCDSGSGDHVGCFQSQVLGIGPQIGLFFPVGGMQGYLNIKAYGEFDASDRPSGWERMGHLGAVAGRDCVGHPADRHEIAPGVGDNSRSPPHANSQIMPLAAHGDKTQRAGPALGRLASVSW